jgi:hypothetical protein
MKAALKKKWVAALRSGKYKQGHGALRIKGAKKDAFCCLGVLADVAGCKWDSAIIEAAKATDVSPEVTRGKKLRGIAGACGVLPDKIAKRFGIDGDLPSGDNLQSELSSRNDHGYNFEQIATWIEKSL